MRVFIDLLINAILQIRLSITFLHYKLNYFNYYGVLSPIARFTRVQLSHVEEDASTFTNQLSFPSPDRFHVHQNAPLPRQVAWNGARAATSSCSCVERDDQRY